MLIVLKKQIWLLLFVKSEPDNSILFSTIIDASIDLSFAIHAFQFQFNLFEFRFNSFFLVYAELSDDNIEIMWSNASLSRKCDVQKSLLDISLENDILVAFTAPLQGISQASRNLWFRKFGWEGYLALPLWSISVYLQSQEGKKTVRKYFHSLRVG